MPSYRYLIVGGGMTADAAAHGIREMDTSGTIGLISREPDPPYNRPPLTKGLWKGDQLDSVWRKTEDARVDLLLGRNVTAVDVATKSVIDDRGERHQYDKLLLATGASPRRLPFGGDDVIYYRGLSDYRRVRSMVASGAPFVIIGGGFIGSEIAAALAMNDCKVTLLFPEDGIGARLFPADLASHLVGYYREKGVDVIAGAKVTDIVRRGNSIAVATASGQRFDALAVIAGVGVGADSALAEHAGLAVDDGIIIDEQLRTSAPDVFAAGDVARFTAPQLGRRVRVEHEDNALVMGHAAGRAMAGDTTKYEHLPFFYSDLFELGYEAVGDTDSRLETVADWHEPFRQGIVYYLGDGRVRGVLLWGIFGKVDEARALIGASGPITAATVNGRISTA